MTSRALAALPPGLDLGRVLRKPDDYLVKAKPHRRVLYVPGSPGYYVKLFHPVLLRKWLAGFLPLPLGAREYHVATFFLANGISTYRPIGHGILYRGWLPVGSWFVSEEISGALSLVDLLEENPTGELRWRLMARYGETVARAHRIGFFLRDVNAENILARVDGDEPKLFVIDHEVTRPFSGYGAARRARDVDYALRSGTRGSYSETDRTAFLTSYRSTLEPVAS